MIWSIRMLMMKERLVRPDMFFYKSISPCTVISISPVILLRVVTIVLIVLVSVGCASPKALQKAEDVHREKASQQEAAAVEEALRTSETDFNFLLGELGLYEERFKEAEEYFEKAARAETSAAPTLRKRLAQLYLRDQRLDDALREIELGVKDSPEDLGLIKLRAGLLATLRRYDEAITAYRKVVEADDGDSSDAYIFMASLYAQQGNAQGAKGVLNELLKKSPDSFFAYYYLAKISAAAGELTEAEKYYKKALSLSADAETVQLELVRVYAFQKRYDQAISLCEEMVKKNPASIKARELLGELLLGRDRADDAIKQFEAIGALETDPTETRLKIALIKLQRTDLEGAETDLRLVLAQHPDNSTARYYLATAYAGLERPEDAIEVIEKIKPGAKYFDESRSLRAYLLRQLKRYDEALKLLTEMLDEKPKNIKLLGLLAAMQAEAGRYGDAVDTMRRVIEIEPSEDLHYFTIGVYFDQDGKKSECIESMEKAIELDPTNANALNYLGYTFAEQGVRLDEAEDLVGRAIALEPDNGFYIDSLGWVYFQKGRYKEALSELERAASIESEDAVILEHLARALLKVDRKKDALSVLEKARRFAPESDDKEAGARIDELLKDLK